MAFVAAERLAKLACEIAGLALLELAHQRESRHTRAEGIRRGGAPSPPRNHLARVSRAERRLLRTKQLKNGVAL
jgi:hypothetical protein